MLTFDTHVHTIHSGDSPCEVEEVISAAKRKGLDGIAITDHDTVRGLEEAFEITQGEDFLIIPGIEVSSEDGHILGLGIEEQIPSELPAAETVRRIRKGGGIAVAAHPFGLSLKPFAVLKANYDAVEVYNPRRYLGNRLAKKYAAEHSLPVTAGSDAHFCDEVGLAGIKLDMDSKPNFDMILRKIKTGKASVFGRALPLSGYLRRALFRCSVYR